MHEDLQYDRIDFIMTFTLTSVLRAMRLSINMAGQSVESLLKIIACSSS